MSFAEISFEDSLKKSVVNTGKCVGCGACVVVCPFKCLEYVDGKPVLMKECKVCGICARVCPQYEWSWSEAENFVFGRKRRAEEDFGVYRRLVLARAKNTKTLRVGQDGGVVTALLLFALKKGIIDSAAVSGKNKEKPFYPIPRMSTLPEEILECAGTKYFYSPNMFAVAEGAKRKKACMAFIGTPCQIRAIRKMQIAGLKKCTASIKFLVGLLCSECFNYEGLMEKHIHGKLGINLGDIIKMNIKGKILVTTKSGVTTVPLADVRRYARKSCRFCDDFSAELADISVGGLGLDGWTFVIVRTEAGEKLLEEAGKAGVLQTKPVEKDDSALNLLVKLSRKKRVPVSE